MLYVEKEGINESDFTFDILKRNILSITSETATKFLYISPIFIFNMPQENILFILK